MGGGRGYGPTHSQSLESLFLGIPNLQVIYLNNYLNPIKIYNQLSKIQTTPVVFLENKLDYSRKYRGKKLVTHNFLIDDELFQTIILESKSNNLDFLIVTYGGGLSHSIDISQDLALSHDIFCNVICFSNLSSPNIYHIKKGLKY